MILPDYPDIRQIGDQLWILLKDWKFWDRFGRVFEIKAGFKFNLLSIPRILRPIVSVAEDSRAALAHDFLYITKILSRYYADLLLFDYMLWGRNVFEFTAHSMFWILRGAGWYNWQRC